MAEPEVKETVLYCLEREWKNSIEDKGMRYWAFYPNAFCVRMHDPKAEVLKVRVIEDSDGTYWGWWDLDHPPASKGSTEPRFVFVYPERMLLGMCFPYGMEAEEKRGHGKCYRVRVEVLETVPKNV